MDIKNARDLSKIITLCRKKGVQTIKLATDGTIELTLSDQLPVKQTRQSKKQATADAAEEATKEYTDEQILMWSSGGMPNPITEEN